MSTTWDNEHLLFVYQCPEYTDEFGNEWDADAEFEIKHPKDCPTETWTDINGEEVEYHVCMTGCEIDNVGLDGLEFDPADYPGFNNAFPSGKWAQDAWKGLPDGVYRIAAWSSFVDTWISGKEYDGGLTLLGSADQPLDPARWQGLDVRLEV